MAKLSPDQRNYKYLADAERVGIHKPILAALYVAHASPKLDDEETGLGISPVNRIGLSDVNTFAKQVYYGANTIRSLTDSLRAKGWEASQLWDGHQGRYTDRFILAVAAGYVPTVRDEQAARLEACKGDVLAKAYQEDLGIDLGREKLPRNQAYLDSSLLKLAIEIPRFYKGLPHERSALLEAYRIWQGLDGPAAAMTALGLPGMGTADGGTPNYATVDGELLKFIQEAVSAYRGFPQEREALLRLSQLWRQQDSREEAIAVLAFNTSPQTNLTTIDPALMAFVQRVPQNYRGEASQRNALTEVVQLWRQLKSRAETLQSLGLNAQSLTQARNDPKALENAAAILDRELLGFLNRIPSFYAQKDHQREALIRMVQLWRGLATREQAIASLFEDLKRMNQARRGSPDAPPEPVVVVPARPQRWEPDNIQVYASIIPNGSFTWAEATHGGSRMPPDQDTVDAIVRIAKLAQQARDRIGRPFHVTSWYRPPDVNRSAGGASQSRHIVGDAIDFYCDGLTGDQLYWLLDPWWPGGLGRYSHLPYISHIDARDYRVRWVH
ncbi:MAG TPA: DUF882 domain-containing protein [Oscillatoriaceae cyanobacterium M33_DOE_052]|uniref:DUF882 domain-containing protein n=1 Tax=Planktothricoides sp. SpSt-374 TaxID=2282167 RepID=A0A7C3ZJF1_9CYAN|nr:DUF882 domain-containing protein [Oscillatoriaceae cyanobacterium M33_DOE_052]